VSLNRVVLDSYEEETLVIKSGLRSGQRVVTEGGKLLRPGQAVIFDEEGARS
jgi:hypothetical protein